MTQAVGRPKKAPKKVTVELATHHAAELERLAATQGVRLSTFCAHLLERYSMEQGGMLVSEILKAAVHTEMLKHHNSVRSLLARTALESIATRELSRLTLQAFLKDTGSKTYNEKAWDHAVYALTHPTPDIRAALKFLSESIANDDPTLLIKVKESNEHMTAGLAEVPVLAAQVKQLAEQQAQQQAQMVEMMAQMTQSLSTINRRINDIQKVAIAAIDNLERAEETVIAEAQRTAKEKAKGKPLIDLKGLFK